jgi:hypothetical protein
MYQGCKLSNGMVEGLFFAPEDFNLSGAEQITQLSLDQPPTSISN